MNNVGKSSNTCLYSRNNPCAYEKTMSSITIAGVSNPRTAENAPVAKSIEGYVLIMTNLHPETSEDHIFDVFEEYCRVVNLHLNLDKHTGYVKGYALIEFRNVEDAKEIMSLHKEQKFEILGKTIELDYAFVENPSKSDLERLRPRRVVSREVKDRLEGFNSRDRSPTRN